MNAVERLPRAEHKVEPGFFMFAGMIGKGDERPYCPYVLLMLDTTHAFIRSLRITWGTNETHLRQRLPLCDFATTGTH